mmetsp:Transcript_19645/g.56317  ORF Transcript_19645/g.56317 Transcript_19645/m.56317 type:complete len:266 (-) Transcript_19645:783-1580(-)
MHTHTNVVCVGSCSVSRTDVVMALSPSRRLCMSSSLNDCPATMLSICRAPCILFLMAWIFCRAFSNRSGKDSSRSVWPVGAVSNTITSYFIDCTDCMSSANESASSMPGKADSSSGRTRFQPSSVLSRNSAFSWYDESISMAWRLSNPSMSVGVLVNFCVKASLKLCAGSVDSINTLPLLLASSTAMEHEVVVLPTPPLPPTKIHLYDGVQINSSRVECSISSSSPSAAMAMDMGTAAAAAAAAAAAWRLCMRLSSEGRTGRGCR